ncbi:MAG: response regulator [Microcoleaceae cyanobacterium]
MTKQILVIDDEEDIRELLQIALEMSTDWQVITAASGSEGVKSALQNQPDAIIVDVIMPEMDGPTTVQQLQQNPQTRHIPVIFLTAQTQTTKQPRYTELGVKAVLSKLIDPINFAKQVADIFDWS